MENVENTRPLEGLSILILEDEFLVAYAMEADFKDAGARETTIARTIAEAREATRRPDCAVLDLRVPDGISYGLAEELSTQGTAIVFHSGHADDEDLTRFPQAVICPKPSMPDELTAAVVTSRQRAGSSTT